MGRFEGTRPYSLARQNLAAMTTVIAVGFFLWLVQTDAGSPGAFVIYGLIVVPVAYLIVRDYYKREAWIEITPDGKLRASWSRSVRMVKAGEAAIGTWHTPSYECVHIELGGLSIGGNGYSDEYKTVAKHKMRVDFELSAEEFDRLVGELDPEWRAPKRRKVKKTPRRIADPGEIQLTPDFVYCSHTALAVVLMPVLMALAALLLSGNPSIWVVIGFFVFGTAIVAVAVSLVRKVIVDIRTAARGRRVLRFRDSGVVLIDGAGHKIAEADWDRVTVRRLVILPSTGKLTRHGGGKLYRNYVAFRLEIGDTQLDIGYPDESVRWPADSAVSKRHVILGYSPLPGRWPQLVRALNQVAWA